MERDPQWQVIRTLLQAAAGESGDVYLDMASGTFMYLNPDGTFKISRATEPEIDSDQLEGEPSSDNEHL